MAVKLTHAPPADPPSSLVYPEQELSDTVAVMPIHRAGGKLTRNHTTLIDAAAPLVDFLQLRDEVTKISLGIIKNIGRGTPGMKFHPVTGGWRLVIRGNVSLQEIVVYTPDPEGLRRILLASETFRY